MKKTTAFIGQMPQKFSQRRRIPRVSMIVVAVLIGLGGVYAVIHSLAATDPNLLFNGTSASDYLVQSAPGAITQVADPLGSGQQVFKMTVNNADVAPITPTENPRAELVGPSDINNGDEVWMQNKFLLPSDFPASVPDWLDLMEIYGQPFNGPSPWNVEVKGNSSSTNSTNIEWQRNGTYNYDVPWSMPVVRGQWVTILVHEVLGANGYVEMWVNGQPVTFFAKSASFYYNPNNVAPTTHLAMQTMDASNNGGVNSGRIMQYRAVNMFPGSVTTYSSPLIIGKTEAAVEAADIANGGAGNGGGSSSSTPVTPPADTTAPTVSITSPTNGSTVSGQVPLAASASDNVGVAGVQFKLDGNNLGSEDTASPYTTTWDTTGVANGTHTLTAVARDAAGNTTTSSSVSVTVDNSSGSTGSISGGANTGAPSMHCDLTQNSGESVSAFISRLGANQEGCLIAGTYNLGGNLSNFKTGQIIHPAPAAGGGYQKVTLLGTLSLNADSIQLNDLYIEGVQNAQNVKVVEIESCNHCKLDHLDITTDPANVSFQGILNDTDTTDLEITNNKIHNVGGNGQFDHGIYCHNKMTSGIISGNWIYANAAYGVQFYPDCDGADFSYNVVDGNGIMDPTCAQGTTCSSTSTTNGRGIVFGGEPPLASDNINAHNNVLSTFGTASRPVVSCSNQGTGDSLTSSLIYQASGTADSCTGLITESNNITGEDPQYVDRANHDYRLQTSSPAYSLMGAYATAVPGPRIGTSSGITTPPPDTTAPTVSFTSPANNATVSGIVTATASASDNVGVTKVEFYPDGASTPIITDTSSPYNYSFDSKTLTNGTHTLTAKAYDAAGNNTSSTVTFTVNNPDTTPPSTPTNVKATATNATTVNLTWDASTDSGANATGVAKYDVLRNGVVIAQPTTTSYTDTSAVAGTSYSYVIQAVDGAGNVSASSSAVSVTTPATGPSILFQDNFESGVIDPTKWSPIQALPGRATVQSGGAAQGNDYVHFEVDQGDVEPETGSSRAELTGPVFPEGQDLYISDDIRVPNGVTFSGNWQLIQQMHDQVTNSGSPATAVFLNNPPQLAVGNGVGTPTYWISPNLQTNQWYNLTYHVKLSQDSSVGYIEVWFNGVPQTLTNGQTRMYGKTMNASNAYFKMGIYRSASSTGTSLVDDDNIMIGTSYAAVASGSGGGSSSTTPAPDTTPPSTPTSLTATAASSTQVNLAWNASTDSGGSGLAGYNIYRDGTKLNSTPVTSTSYGDSTVDPSTAYSYTVEAVDGAGNKSAQTSGVNVTTPAAPDTTPPSVPSGLTATAVSSSQVNLTWNASTDSGSNASGLAGYNVYRGGIELNTTPLTATSYSDASVAAGTTYQYSVQAVDNAGNSSDKSGTVSVTTPAASTGGSSGGSTGSGGSTSGSTGSTTPSGPVAVTVVTGHNQPVANATVTIAGQTATTNSSGVAYFTAIPSGKQIATITSGSTTVTKSVRVSPKSTSRHHGTTTQHVTLSLTSASLSPALLLIPVIALAAGGLIILRPWSRKLVPAVTTAEPQVVSSNHPAAPEVKPGHELETPGAVIAPDHTKDK